MRSFSVADEGPDTYELLGKSGKGKKEGGGRPLTFIICWVRVDKGVGTGRRRVREGRRVRKAPTQTNCPVRLDRGGQVEGREGMSVRKAFDICGLLVWGGWEGKRGIEGVQG